MDGIFPDEEALRGHPIGGWSAEPEIFSQVEDQLHGIVTMEWCDMGGVEHRRHPVPEKMRGRIWHPYRLHDKTIVLYNFYSGEPGNFVA